MNVSETTKAVRPVVSRVTSIRQRSRSGDSSPVCLSQLDIVAGGNTIAAATASGSANSGSTIPRSSSDSNILIDKGQSDLTWPHVDLCRVNSKLMYFQCLDTVQGSHASWKVLDFFFLENSRTWKVLENPFSPGKSWKLKLKVLESPVKISLKVMHFSTITACI